jgi:hypothetical protein
MVLLSSTRRPKRSTGNTAHADPLTGGRHVAAHPMEA